jgi:hypothetical protein
LLVLGALLVGWIQPDATGGVLGFFNRTLELLRLGLFLAGMGWIIYNVAVWRTAEYSVTNRRVLGHEGFMRQRSTDTLLTSVSDIRTSTSVLGRMLNSGNVRILSAAGESGKDELTAISNAEQFKQAVLEQKAGSGVAPPTPVAPRSAAPVDTGQVVTQIIALLTTLRDTGVLTDAEFKTMRADWLRRL